VEFMGLAKRWHKQQRMLNYRAGLAPAAVLNLFLPRHKRLEPMAFFEGRKTIRQTPEQMLQTIVAFNTALGGRDLRKKKDG
jgi:hypothetical protein